MYNKEDMSVTKLLKFATKYSTKKYITSEDYHTKLLTSMREEFEITSKSQSLKVILKEVILKVFSSSKSAGTLMKTFPKLKKIIETLDMTLNTKRQYYSDIRQSLLSPKGNFTKEDKVFQDTFKHLSISKDQAKTITDLKTRKVFERNENRREIDLDQVTQVMDKLKSSPRDKYDLCLLIQLNTGLRLIESLYVSKFETIQGEQSMVKIVGLAKNKSEKSVNEVTNPLINLTYDELIALQKEMRDELNLEGTLKAITNRYSNKINKRVKEFFGPDSTSHDLRRMYGSLSYIKYAPKEMSINVWLNQHLGHSQNSLASTNFYSDIIFVRNGERIDLHSNELCEQVDDNDRKEINEVKKDVGKVKKDVAENRENIIVLDTIVSEKPTVNKSEHIVYLVAKDGITVVTIPKHVKKRNGKAIEACIEMIRFLISKSVDPSNKNLRLTGFSGRIAKEGLIEAKRLGLI
jgi:integrase